MQLERDAIKTDAYKECNKQLKLGPDENRSLIMKTVVHSLTFPVVSNDIWGVLSSKGSQFAQTHQSL